jgi:hypothetical protein
LLRPKLRNKPFPLKTNGADDFIRAVFAFVNPGKDALLRVRTIIA